MASMSKLESPEWQSYDAVIKANRDRINDLIDTVNELNTDINLMMDVIHELVKREKKRDAAPQL